MLTARQMGKSSLMMPTAAHPWEDGSLTIGAADTTMDERLLTNRDTGQMLGGVSLFAGLAPRHLAALALRMRPQVFEPGQLICRQGDPGDCLFVICQGRVRIELPAEGGSPVILALREPGEIFGELALLDGKPRSASAVALEPTQTLTLSRQDFQIFLQSAPQAATHILGLLSERLRQTSGRLQELAIGRRMQSSLLGPRYLSRGRFEIMSRLEPAMEVGGDFYNVFELGAGGPEIGSGSPLLTPLGLVLGDVAGKGVPAALFMAVTTTIIEAQARLLPSPATTLAAANAQLYPKMRPPGGREPLFVTAVYGVLDVASGALRLANAGQTPPIYWPAVGRPSYVRLTGLPLGARPSSQYAEVTLHLSPGDRLLFSSDGFVEERSPEGEAVGYTGFLERLEQLEERSGEELIHALFEGSSLSSSDESMTRDDRTLMLITAG